MKSDINWKTRENLLVIIMIGLFNFVFLGTEFLFDNLIGLYTDPANVTIAQNIVLGASVLGFVLFGFLGSRIKERSKKVFALLYLIAGIVTAIMYFIHNSYWMVFVAGVICFVMLGIVGAKAFYLATIRVSDRRILARIVGLAYGVGVGFQFLLNNFAKGYNAQTLALFIGFLAFLGITMLLQEKDQKNDTDSTLGNDVAGMKNEIAEISNASRKAVLSLVITVALLTVIFSTLDNAMTIVHASKQYDIGQWPRLILALGGIISGFLYDLKDRKLMPVIMHLTAFAASGCVIMTQFDGSVILSLIVFYISAGFFAVFFTTAFMEVSYNTKRPGLWAGFGRAVNNVAAFTLSIITVNMLSSNNPTVLVIVVLTLMALISVATLAYALNSRKLEFSNLIIEDESFVCSQNPSVTDFTINDSVITTEAISDVSDTENNPAAVNKLDLFADTFGLTKREKEVLKTLISSDKPVQELAVDLAMSRAALYRHISNMNERTNTNNRRGLIQFYFDWKV